VYSERLSVTEFPKAKHLWDDAEFKYADGRTLRANTGGLEPSTIPHGKFVFTVHYVQLDDTPRPDDPKWVAFALVVFDQGQRVYPVELFDFPKDQQPPSVDGTGFSHIEAYREVRRKLLGLTPGELPAN
jgi:hypothetical protein